MMLATVLGQVSPEGSSLTGLIGVSRNLFSPWLCVRHFIAKGFGVKG